VVRDFAQLPEASREAMRDYFDGFWEVIATPDLAQRRLFRDYRDVR
jgi:hypothetical protein